MWKPGKFWKKSRETIAQKLNAQTSELIFTSGFTESSNIALKGVAMALEKKKGNHIIVSKIEDYSVLNTAQSLEKQGFQVTYLEVDEYGLVDPDILNDQITPETILVSIQQANQEIGTLQDLKSVGEVCNDKGVLFHTDATHTFTRTPLDLEKNTSRPGHYLCPHHSRTIGYWGSLHKKGNIHW
nr:aminotransferase class V-fold PLP-dependent enzyme [Methanobacterium formicicum]